VTIRSFRPFPLDEIHEVLKNTRRVVVFEKCLAVGLGGIVASNVRMAHRGQTSPVYTVIGGLGGRPITRASLQELFEKAMTDDLEETTFLDLKQDVVDQEMEREKKFSRSGAIAENILRDVGVVDVAKTT
jgi:pyruvate ferredoxin oxidoreductase alpha subunit